MLRTAAIAMEQPPPVAPSLEEIDVTRHREITSKAVSAILLLTLKWFKVSREFHMRYHTASRLLTEHLSDVMKFHHLGQILLDTNCLLLILKMFGLQEVSTTVVSKADAPEEKYVTAIAFYLFCPCSRDPILVSSGTVNDISVKESRGRALKMICSTRPGNHLSFARLSCPTGRNMKRMWTS